MAKTAKSSTCFPGNFVHPSFYENILLPKNNSKSLRTTRLSKPLLLIIKLWFPLIFFSKATGFESPCVLIQIPEGTASKTTTDPAGPKAGQTTKGGSVKESAKVSCRLGFFLEYFPNTSFA